MTPRYLIGIDLGTTNSALAYIDLQRSGRGAPRIEHFAVPQLVAPGEVAPRPLLPSFLYLPGEHDLPAGAAALPWDAARRWIVGELARNHGARVPGRLVTSAKSWLCHAGVDRSAPLLPWTAPPEVPRLSPVQASARYLEHFRDSWNYFVAQGEPEARLEKQLIVLTVPASFDDMARNLTVEAARLAGLEHLVLLEEPQAAFYCWLALHSAEEAARLTPGACCLVVDVGGGTTDFSLIQAVEQAGELGFVRRAVGEHLLLGGDNMDLALARFVESKFPQAGKLDAVQYSLLTQACRQAKEALLGPKPPASYGVTVMGRGRQVVGGALHTTLTPAEVQQVLLEGFFPFVPPDAEPVRGARLGLHEMGLPYVSDPAITRHLAAFLRRHSPEQPPQAVLFNGGVFQPALLRQRLLEVLHRWYQTVTPPWQPLVLTNPSLDLAVAWGAAYYAWLRYSGGRRIGGGMARSYYLGLDTGAAVPAAADRQTLTVLCVVPRGLEEGQEIHLTEPTLELALGQPVAFPLFTSTVRSADQAGQLLTVTPGQLLSLPPLHTVLRGGKRSGTKRVPVTLSVRLTEIGTLELWCVARGQSQRWRLEFNVRDVLPPTEDSEPDVRPAGDVWPEEPLQEAGQLIRATYAGQPGAPTPADLPRALEAVLETPRARWPTGLCRRLWDFLAQVAEARRRSTAHLARWYHLAGYCLRPGFGDPLDRYRVEQLWKLLQTPPRPEPGQPPPPRQAEGSADYWILWRRVAGGLNAALQNTLWSRLRPFLLPPPGKHLARPPANELAEMWRTAASLERLEVSLKEQLGQALLKTVRRRPVPPYAFWALTRLGARSLLYGPLNAVVHPQRVADWLRTLLTFQPTNDSERLAWLFCLTQLARRTGQLALDVEDELRQQVLHVLHAAQAPPRWQQLVAEATPLAVEESNQLFGESLPLGLRLLSPEEHQ